MLLLTVVSVYSFCTQPHLHFYVSWSLPLLPNPLLFSRFYISHMYPLCRIVSLYFMSSIFMLSFPGVLPFQLFIIISLIPSKIGCSASTTLSSSVFLYVTFSSFFSTSTLLLPHLFSLSLVCLHFSFFSFDDSSSDLIPFCLVTFW